MTLHFASEAKKVKMFGNYLHWNTDLDFLAFGRRSGALRDRLIRVCRVSLRDAGGVPFVLSFIGCGCDI